MNTSVNGFFSSVDHHREDPGDGVNTACKSRECDAGEALLQVVEPRSLIRNRVF